VVDCSEVARIDYAYIGNFIGYLMQLLGSGKVITLQGQNALVDELFRNMGIDQLANLIPAKLG
jgi:anti-anti-sigma regulatory factor